MLSRERLGLLVVAILAGLPGEVRHRLDPVLEQPSCLRYLA